MTERIVIVGGGIAGLSAALALGRAGHDVTVVEGDELPVAGDAEEAFATSRIGAPQVHQTHGFLARIRLALRERFPDVLGDVLAAGGMEMPTTADLGEPQPGDDDLKVLIMRRTTFEWILRRAALAQDNVTILTGVRVAKLLATNDGIPVVTGVQLTDGGELRADIVVAATGRRGPVPAWLDEIGVTLEETVRDSDLMYLTRWYRFPGGQIPDIDPKLGGDLRFVKYLAVPGDGGTLSITLAIRPDDRELRRALSQEAGFEEACRILPGPKQFFDNGDALEPLGGVRPMGGLLNRIRRFQADGRPLVLGFHAIGDAHTCTNPLYGRGCSLAVVQALLLADAIEGHAGDPVGRALAYEQVCAREIEPWFHTAVQMDEAGADPSGMATSTAGKAMAAVFVAAATDPVLGRGLARFWNLLSTPADLIADATYTTRAAEVMASPDDWPVPAPEGPSRTELLDLLSTPA